MDSGKQPEIYFHVGLGRTATTFMQRSIFPMFNDIYYIKKNEYKNADGIIRSTQQPKYLISHEFYSGVLINEMTGFLKKYPEAHIIIVLRRQDKWMASHYKRRVKNGYSGTIKDYIDLQNDNGLCKKQDLLFYPMLLALNNLVIHKPLILFHHELKDSPQAFLQKILDFTGVKDTRHISFKPRHTSYNDKALKVRQWLSQDTPFRELSKDHNPWPLKELKRFYNKIIRYTALNIGMMIPGSWVRDRQIIPEDYLKEIKEFTKDDWEKCLEHAAANNPV